MEFFQNTHINSKMYFQKKFMQYLTQIFTKTLQIAPFKKFFSWAYPLTPLANMCSISQFPNLKKNIDPPPLPNPGYAPDMDSANHTWWIKRRGFSNEVTICLTSGIVVRKFKGYVGSKFKIES